jgi:hypothetical protein
MVADGRLSDLPNRRGDLRWVKDKAFEEARAARAVGQKAAEKGARPCPIFRVPPASRREAAEVTRQLSSSRTRRPGPTGRIGGGPAERAAPMRWPMLDARSSSELTSPTTPRRPEFSLPRLLLAFR